MSSRNLARWSTTHLLKIFRPLTAIVLVTAARQGCYLRLIACCPRERRTGRTLRSSSGQTSVVFNLAYGRPYPAYRPQALLPPLPVSVCFFCGGLGVGEKPTYGELVPLSPRRKSGRFSLTIGNLRKNLRSQLNIAFEVFFCRVDGDLF